MALPDTQQAIQLLRLPQGMPQAADFGLTRRPLPVPADGELLLRTHTLSLDPYLRPLLAGRYVVPQPALGTIVPGIGLAAFGQKIIQGPQPQQADQQDRGRRDGTEDHARLRQRLAEAEQRDQQRENQRLVHTGVPASGAPDERADH